VGAFLSEGHQLLSARSLFCKPGGVLAQAEMRQGLSYFQSTIFSSLPIFYRRIDTALKQVTLRTVTRFSKARTSTG